jgi:protoheme IX farnesyltransferase
MRTSVADVSTNTQSVVARRGLSQTLAPYLELTKPRVTSMVLLTTAAGYYLGSSRDISIGGLLCVLVGTGLLAGGTAVLNQFMERDADRLMRRTARRPLPAGKVTPQQALHYGMLLVSLGTIFLLASTNVLTAFLGWLTSVVYLLIYTPMKTRSPWCTLIGAVPGAIPPVMGWTAARGALTMEAVVLFGILFCWQFPHFLAIAWVYREDYERGGFQMLPRGERRGTWMGLAILLFSILLLPVSFAPYWLGLDGSMYMLASAVLGSGFLLFSLNVARLQTRFSARRLLQSSVAYLPFLLLFLTIGKL